ncbi:MAG: hypothetical protein C5617_004550 [ANME-2 cluster archaeon]|jgi:hypothetical protein|nr:MAG: hypothetical protein C5617_004550 [ANME-2 cluster archaeon]
MRKVVLLFLVFFMLMGTAHAGLTISDGSCKIKDLEGSATVTLTLKNTGDESIKVQAPMLPSPSEGITLSILDKYPITIPKNESKAVQIKVQITKIVSKGVYNATASFDHLSTLIGATITINVDRQAPAHLAPLQNINITDPVIFDKPRKEMENTGFKVVKKFEIINDGNMAMTVKSVAAYGTPGAGMAFKVNYPTKIDGQSAGAANLTITIPVTAPEGTHEGKLRIDAGKAGSQTITVKVTVKHAVKFEMSSYDPNFGRVDVLKSIPLEISLSETLGYKDITAVKIQRETTTVADGKDDWMAVNLPASIIQKGKTVPLTFTLRFRGETIVGRTYTWQYFLSHSVGNETITLKATAMPIDIEGTKSALATMKASGNPEISKIAGDTFNMLSSSGAGSAEAWASVTTIAQSSVTFLDAMDRAVEDVDKGDHDDALDDLLVARIAVATMYRSAKTQAQTNIYTASNKFLKSTLAGESAYFEKMALDAGDDRTRIIAYRHSATAYELLNDPGRSKRASDRVEESISSYNLRSESATDHYVNADDAIRRASDDLYRWGDCVVLVNPFVYDSTSYRYKFAINETETSAGEYMAAGEFELSDESALRAEELHDQWLFLLGQFLMLMIGYVILFACAVLWCVLAFMAFTADSREEEFGDVVLLS